MAAFSKPSSLMSILLTVFVLLQVTVAFKHGAHKHLSHSMNVPVDPRSALVDRASKVVVKGAPGQCPRLEIREMKKNADQWNLFLLAMEKFQNKPKNDPMSYYQIAGIHGRPYVPWDDNPIKHPGGNCPHRHPLFGSWHRPYLAVYEVCF